MTRHFFAKAIAPAPKPAPPPRLVVASYTDIRTGKVQHRLMSGAQAKHQLDAARGGTLVHATGRAREWTSQQARRAAQKRWKAHPITRTGRHLGEPSARRPQTPRAPLRARYTLAPCKGVWFDPVVGWRRRVHDGTRWLAYGISERTALIHLGYIPARDRNRGFVPETVVAIPLPGTAIAAADTK